MLRARLGVLALRGGTHFALGALILADVEALVLGGLRLRECFFERLMGPSLLLGTTFLILFGRSRATKTLLSEDVEVSRVLTRRRLHCLARCNLAKPSSLLALLIQDLVD